MNVGALTRESARPPALSSTNSSGTAPSTPKRTPANNGRHQFAAEKICSRKDLQQQLTPLIM
jgi:hypothetical protein